MIRLVVALPAEARPLIRHLSLAPTGAGDFPLWLRGDTALVISGIGRKAAAAATGWLAARTPGRDSAWLNLGIGGHPSLPVGQVVLAREVFGAADGCVWRAVPLGDPPCATSRVTTVDRPETTYPEATVYEMEAAGFCGAAARFTRPELIQVAKVISDNSAVSVERLSAAAIEDLVASRLEVLACLVERTADLVRRGQRKPV